MLVDEQMDTITTSETSNLISSSTNTLNNLPNPQLSNNLNNLNQNNFQANRYSIEHPQGLLYLILLEKISMK